jgi:hypothetical protein
MAKQMSVLPFTGKLGNLIGSRRNGQYFVRRKPEVVRQTSATRRAAQRFGIASRKGALIRHAFYHDLDIRCDSGHVNRLNTLLLAAGSNPAAITGYRFNMDAGIDRFFTVAPRLFKSGILHIPSQTLIQYKGISAVEVKVIGARIDFVTRQVTGTATVQLSIDACSSFEGINVPLDVPGDGTLVVTLQVSGMQKDGVSCNRQYLAADIIAVAEQQTPNLSQNPTYPQWNTLQSQTTPDLPYAHAYASIIQRK